jgi:hypothetical protein
LKKSRSQVGNGKVRPAVPLVRLTQLTAITWTRNRNATVMITNAGPRDRSATSPRPAATIAAVTPATGTHSHGETVSKREASTPMV